MSQKTLEQKLWEAWRNNRGVLLTADDVHALLFRDDAMGCRVSNAAATEAGGEEPGMDCINQFRNCKTWAEFCAACAGKEGGT